MFTLGNQLATIVGSMTQTFGQQVLITPSAARKAEGEKSFTAYATIDAPDPASVQQLRLEGDLNADNSDAHNFTFAGNAGVQEGDTATYKGVSYKLFNAPQQPLQGASVATMCIGIRVK